MCVCMSACVHCVARVRALSSLRSVVCVCLSPCVLGWVRSLTPHSLRSSSPSVATLCIRGGCFGALLSLLSLSLLSWWSVREVACFLACLSGACFLTCFLLACFLTLLSLSVLSPCWYSLSYHLRCSESFAGTRARAHSSPSHSFNLSWILVPRLLVRFSLSL